VTLLFVYGTLRPGEARWHHLEPYVVGEGAEASVAGELYDTGLEYPAARFGGDHQIFGRVYTVNEALLPQALAHLDEVEGAVRGVYRRVEVVTAAGETVWAYECGEAALLRTRIESGDWQRRAHDPPRTD
jgi:gamma-glutamylcyclotransferase (GGCT)/AIG2-like uncharacterized protein YtfP